MSRSILIFGTGGHAKSCIDVLKSSEKYELSGFVSESGDNKTLFEGYPIIGQDHEIKKIRLTFSNALIGIGQIKSSKTRTNLFKLLKKNDFKIPAIYSKYAYVSDHSYVDEGTIVMHHGLVNAGSKIGKNCIINNKALIEHDVIIEDNCHISTGAILNGGVEIGSGSFIGSGSIIRESVRIGENCIIGAGNYINNDLTKNSFIKRNEK